MAAGRSTTASSRSGLRDGKRITIDTLERIRAYMGQTSTGIPGVPVIRPPEPPLERRDPRGNFRFFENRQKYLLFVHTCSEKRVIAERVGLELASIHPRPPAVRVFDAGVGDGTVLTRVMRSMHGRFPHMPFYIAGKEISLEDIKLVLQKLPDRLYEHPATVFVLTNMAYAEAPWLQPEIACGRLQPGLARGGPDRVRRRPSSRRRSLNCSRFSTKTGAPTSPSVPACRFMNGRSRWCSTATITAFMLDPVIPKPGRAEANFDLIIASQPYRAKSSETFRAKRIIAPLARALRAGGRLIGIHSHGHDPGMEIIEAVWPGENPFSISRHELLRAVKYELGSAGRDLNFNAYADHRSIFRYDMEALPNEVMGPIGTSTAFAAWNAAVYVAQIEDDRLTEVTQSGRYLDATKDVLRKHNGLWFYDESYVISRRRD